MLSIRKFTLADLRFRPEIIEEEYRRLVRHSFAEYLAYARHPEQFPLSPAMKQLIANALNSRESIRSKVKAKKEQHREKNEAKPGEFIVSPISPEDIDQMMRDLAKPLDENSSYEIPESNALRAKTFTETNIYYEDGGREVLSDKEILDSVIFEAISYHYLAEVSSQFDKALAIGDRITGLTDLCKKVEELNSESSDQKLNDAVGKDNALNHYDFLKIYINFNNLIRKRPNAKFSQIAEEELRKQYWTIFHSNVYTVDLTNKQNTKTDLNFLKDFIIRYLIPVINSDIEIVSKNAVNHPANLFDDYKNILLEANNFAVNADDLWLLNKCYYLLLNIKETLNQHQFSNQPQEELSNTLKIHYKLIAEANNLIKYQGEPSEQFTISRKTIASSHGKEAVSFKIGDNVSNELAQSTIAGFMNKIVGKAIKSEDKITHEIIDTNVKFISPKNQTYFIAEQKVQFDVFTNIAFRPHYITSPVRSLFKLTQNGNLELVEVKTSEPLILKALKHETLSLNDIETLRPQPKGFFSKFKERILTGSVLGSTVGGLAGLAGTVVGAILGVGVFSWITAPIGFVLGTAIGFAISSVSGVVSNNKEKEQRESKEQEAYLPKIDKPLPQKKLTVTFDHLKDKYTEFASNEFQWRSEKKFKQILSSPENIFSAVKERQNVLGKYTEPLDINDPEKPRPYKNITSKEELIIALREIDNNYEIKQQPGGDLIIALKENANPNYGLPEKERVLTAYDYKLFTTDQLLNGEVSISQLVIFSSVLFSLSFNELQMELLLKLQKDLYQIHEEELRKEVETQAGNNLNVIEIIDESFEKRANKEAKNYKRLKHDKDFLYRNQDSNSMAYAIKSIESSSDSYSVTPTDELDDDNTQITPAAKEIKEKSPNLLVKIMNNVASEKQKYETFLPRLQQKFPTTDSICDFLAPKPNAAVSSATSTAQILRVKGEKKHPNQGKNVNIDGSEPDTEKQNEKQKEKNPVSSELSKEDNQTLRKQHELAFHTGDAKKLPNPLETQVKVAHHPNNQ